MRQGGRGEARLKGGKEIQFSLRDGIGGGW